MGMMGLGGASRAGSDAEGISRPASRMGLIDRPASAGGMEMRVLDLGK